MRLLWTFRLRHDKAFECKSADLRILLAVWDYYHPE